MTNPAPRKSTATAPREGETPSPSPAPSPAPTTVQVPVPAPLAVVYAALGKGTAVQSTWVECPLHLDGLDLVNSDDLTLSMLRSPADGIVEASETGAILRVSDCVLLHDRTHDRYLSILLNVSIRAEVGATLVLPQGALREPLGLRRSAEIGWLGGHGAFLGATTPH